MFAGSHVVTEESEGGGPGDAEKSPDVRDNIAVGDGAADKGTADEGAAVEGDNEDVRSDVEGSHQLELALFELQTELSDVDPALAESLLESGETVHPTHKNPIT